jgi:hypothetical protein
MPLLPASGVVPATPIRQFLTASAWLWIVFDGVVACGYFRLLQLKRHPSAIYKMLLILSSNEKVWNTIGMLVRIGRAVGLHEEKLIKTDSFAHNQQENR